jgi:hypothetical protein
MSSNDNYTLAATPQAYALYKESIVSLMTAERTDYIVFTNEGDWDGELLDRYTERVGISREAYVLLNRNLRDKLRGLGL